MRSEENVSSNQNIAKPLVSLFVLPLPLLVIIIWFILVVAGFFLGFVFRIIDVPVALCNILTCHWTHGWRCDLYPVAGENYFKYLVCCTFSLVVNAFMPADLDALIDQSETCCVLFEAMVDGASAADVAETGIDLIDFDFDFDVEQTEENLKEELGEAVNEAFDDGYKQAKQDWAKKTSKSQFITIA